MSAFQVPTPACIASGDCLRFNPGCSAAIPGCLCGSSSFWSAAANCACSACDNVGYYGFLDFADAYCVNHTGVVDASFSGVCTNATRPYSDPNFSLTGGKAGPIAGAVAGGVAAVAMLVTAFFVIMKKRSMAKQVPTTEEEMQTISVLPKDMKG